MKCSHWLISTLSKNHNQGPICGWRKEQCHHSSMQCFIIKVCLLSARHLLPQLWWPSCPAQARSSGKKKKKKNPSSSLGGKRLFEALGWHLLIWGSEMDTIPLKVNAKVAFQCTFLTISSYDSLKKGVQDPENSRRSCQALAMVGRGRGGIWGFLGHRWNCSVETAGIVCFQVSSPPTPRWSELQVGSQRTSSFSSQRL